MSLQPGHKLAHYEILEPIGKGGMGEVYRARDGKLGRDVAIKVLPEEFAQDTERLRRFQREAKVLASLNHPNIASIYGLEQSDATHYLVLELVPGETLAERIARGPIPVAEALDIATKIAEALEAAHELGIVHRDLKPANIKLTPDDNVKVLDFGLAKAFIGDSPDADSSMSPTITRDATRAGVILGTAAYMSPEQAKGKSVDRRADIWSFGVVLFEMLTAKRLFSGETASETLASVIKDAPDWNHLPAETPSRIRQLLRRCLNKDPKERLRDIGEARITIDRPEEEYVATLATSATWWRRALPWGVTVAVAALALWAMWQSDSEPKRPVRLSAAIGADASLAFGDGPAAVLSPDGSMLAFVAREGEAVDTQLFVRRLDQTQASALLGTEGARNLFFSPDGKWIGFFASGKLKKIAVVGGAAVTLADAGNDRGGGWSEDGTIVFTSNNRDPLLRVSSAGGTPEPLTTLDEEESEVSHRWPQVLPGGKAVLFTASAVGNNYEEAHFVVQALASGERKIVHRGGFHARYLLSGHLAYVHEGTLFVAPFDLDRLEMTGAPAPVLENVTALAVRGAAQYAVSGDGTLVYVPGGTTIGVTIDWMDREGRRETLRSEPGLYASPRFSPDGRRLAVNIGGDVWVYDWARDTMSRLTFTAETDAAPVWTPDGGRIVFGSTRDDPNKASLYWKRADGTGDVQSLTESEYNQWPGSWDPSGGLLAFQEQNVNTVAWDVRILPMEGDESSGWEPGEPTTFLDGPYSERHPSFSPDGRFLAYASNESGSYEVYVQSFPGPGGKWLISTDGGDRPTWSPNGAELFYRTADGSRIMVSTYAVEGETFRHDQARLWSEGRFNRGLRFSGNFDIHPDGNRFAVLRYADTEVERDKVTFVFNFFEELERLVPTDN